MSIQLSKPAHRTSKVTKVYCSVEWINLEGSYLEDSCCKTRFQERMAKERLDMAAAEAKEALQKTAKDKKKKRKREMKGVDGKEGPNQEVVNEKNVEGLTVCQIVAPGCII